MRTSRYTCVQQQKSRLSETQTHQLNCKYTHTHTHAHVKTEGISSTDMDIIQCKKQIFFILFFFPYLYHKNNECTAHLKISWWKKQNNNLLYVKQRRQRVSRIFIFKSFLLNAKLKIPQKKKRGALMTDTMSNKTFVIYFNYIFLVACNINIS